MMRKKKWQLVAVDVMVELAPNTLAPSALNELAPSALVKARLGCPKKKVVVVSGLLQKPILQFFSK
jgi:hypothetical protein